LAITILPVLKFRSTISLDYYLTYYDGYTSADYGFMAGRGDVSKSYDRNIATTWTNVLTYNQSFGKHTLGVTLGEESYQRQVKGLSAERQDFPFGGLYELSSGATMVASTSYEDNYRLLSFFSRAEYDYDNKYYVSASLRTDGSSKFSKSSRWGTFWSVGASWRMNKEEWMADIDWIDNLKLRASYGAVGNDGLSSWYCYQGLYATGYNPNGKSGVMISRLPNEDLRWESNMQTTIGVDFSLFNKLSGSFEWFDRTSKDLLFPMPKASSTGISSIDKNVGTIRNSGVELTLDWRVMDKRDFQWNMSFNATHYRNKIVSLPQGEIDNGYFKWREGESRFNFWGPEYAGVNPENGRKQYWMNVYQTNADGSYATDADGDYIVVERVKTEDTSLITGDEQKTYLGESTPKFFGSWTNTFNFHGFDVSFMWYYSLGGKLCDSDYVGTGLTYRQGFANHVDILDSWTETNTDSDIPIFYKGDQSTFSSQYLYDNTFFRLRNVTVGYTLPRRLTSKIDISALRVYVQADNILTTGEAAARGTDPEQSVDGITANRFPTTKSWTVGLQVTF